MGKEYSNSSRASGEIVAENLPLKTVFYPNDFGTFFAFSEERNRSYFLCSCTKGAIENLVQLKIRLPRPSNINPLREALLDSHYFPNCISKLSLSNLENPIQALSFQKDLCHRCNVLVPTLWYCDERNGTRFIQKYGWYVNQAFLRLGIMPVSLDFLSTVCPMEYQDEINGLKRERASYVKEHKRIMEMVFGPTREGIKDDEITYMRNVRNEDAQELIRLRRLSSKRERSFTKKIENIAREEFGFRNVGEKWISETILFKLVCQIFKNQKIVRHYRDEWLGRLELDIYVPNLKIAFEYQGQQHFKPIKAWGGERALNELQERDKKKAEICFNQGVKLIAVDHTEPLTEEHILNRLHTFQLR